MKSVTAFAPGNVSCIFRIIENKDRRKRHSLGLGFTTDKGAYVTVSEAKKTEIYTNGRKVHFPTVLAVLNDLTDKKVKVEIKFEVPFGAGFGMSGASALGTAYALNKLLNLGKSKKELAMFAHEAEALNGTGLGDVGGQFNGGMCAKFVRGNPLKGTRMPLNNLDIFYKVFGPLETKGIITDPKWKNLINKAGDRALNRIKLLKNKNIESIIGISKEFAVQSRLLMDKRVRQLVTEIEGKGGHASMIMLGHSVFSNIPFKGAKRVRISRRSACLV